MTNIGKKIDKSELDKVSGGVGGASVSIKAVGDPIRVSGIQTKCPKCSSTSLVAQRFSTDNGRTAYEGQECCSCSAALIYGESIM